MENEKNYAQTYGGKVGGLVPLVGMLAAIIILCFAGMGSLRNFWGAGFLAIALGLIVYKDKNRYAKAVMKGFSNPSFMMLFPIFIAAGILSQILTAAHLVDGLVYLVSLVNIPPAIIPGVTFLLCAVMSTVTGSSAAALLSTMPMPFPMGVQMGCPAGLVLGAICSGSEFGNNLSPISDVTITSSIGQEVDIATTVRTRVWYSIAAGVPALILFFVFGLATTKSVDLASLSADSSSSLGLIFIIIPILVAVMILRKANFLVALVLGDLLGILLLLVLGYTDAASIFASDGLLASGTLSLMDVLIFMALIFVVLALTEEVGVLDSFQAFMVKHAKSPRMAETISGLFTCIICVVIGSGMSTIAFISPIVRNIMKPFRIARTRAANYIAGFASGLSWMVPHGVNTLTALAVAIGTGAVGEDFTMLSFIPYNFFCIGLIVVYWAAILTGIGRKKEEGET